MPVNMHAKGHASSSVRRPGEVVFDSVFDDDVADVSQLQSMEQQVDLTFGDTSVPVTPPMFGPALPATPRQPHATRTHETETEGSPESKKAKVETQKKQRFNQLREFHESHIRTVRIGDDEFATWIAMLHWACPVGLCGALGLRAGGWGPLWGHLLVTVLRCSLLVLLEQTNLQTWFIHPASRGVAAHTAGLFRSVRGAKGGVESPPWRLPAFPPRGGFPS